MYAEIWGIKLGLSNVYPPPLIIKLVASLSDLFSVRDILREAIWARDAFSMFFFKFFYIIF